MRTRRNLICRVPGIAVTKSNTVLVTTEARPRRGGDYDFNDLLMRRNTDGGKTFAPAVKLVDHTIYGDGPVSNSVMFNIRNESKNNRRLVSISPDGAAGWSVPRFEEALLEPVCMASLIRLNWPAGGQAAGSCSPIRTTWRTHSSSPAETSPTTARG